MLVAASYIFMFVAIRSEKLFTCMCGFGLATTSDSFGPFPEAHVDPSSCRERSSVREQFDKFTMQVKRFSRLNYQKQSIYSNIILFVKFD